MTLSTVLDLSITSTNTKTRDLSTPAVDPLSISRRITLTDGTAAGKADLMWYDENTLAASGTTNIDLVGALTNAFGDTFSPARIKAVFFEADAGNTNNVIIGAAAATQWAALLGTAGTMTFRPGAWMLFAAGVTDATGYVCADGATDLLKVANSSGGTGVTYRIALIGASA